MIRIRWTGLGCLSPLLLVVIIFASIYIGTVLTGSNNTPAVQLVAGVVMVLLAPLHVLFGLMLNFRRGPTGQWGWNDRHTVYEIPVQNGFFVQLVVALIFGSAGLGGLTSPLYGWLLFGGGVLVGAVVAAFVQRR